MIKFILITASLLSAGVNAEDLSVYNTSKLKFFEAALMNELHMRTCQDFSPVEISYFAASDEKQEEDKKNVIQHIYTLVAKKEELLSRIKNREGKKIHDGAVSVTLQNIHISSKDPNADKYKQPYIAPTNITLGGLTKTEIDTSESLLPLPMYISYCELGKVFVEGKAIPLGKNVPIYFDVSQGNVKYHVTANATSTVSGWN